MNVDGAGNGGSGGDPATVSAPQVSIIVPHYNDLDRLDQCLTLLANQTLPASQYEVIVADNGSRCGIEAVQAVAGERARVVPAPIPGAGPARNAGVLHARGAILAFTDADCLPDREWLRHGLAALESADFVGGRMVVTTASDRMTGVESYETIFAFDNRRYVDEEHFTVTANLLCPRALFDAVGPFRTEVAEDKEWCLRARSKGFRIGYAEGAVVGHPARADWPQLRGKWKRMAAESFALMRERPGGRLRWLARTWALLPSIAVHTPVVLFSGQLSVTQRIGAWGALIRLRWFRFVEGHRLLLMARGK